MLKQFFILKRVWQPLLTLTLLTLATTSFSSEAKMVLADCHLKGIKQQVKCGSIDVPEDYQKPAGKQLKINFAVLPAIDSSTDQEPLMFLAGGPGQAAVELAVTIRKMFNQTRATRDIILVDQRGTGQSSPLTCSAFDEIEGSVYALLPEQFDTAQVQKCLSEMEQNPIHFSSENAIRDFDAIRAALGHSKINLYGGSYGTRAALVYMKMFPESLRSVVLDSVAPIEVPIGLFGQSMARSFNALLQNCQNEAACQQAYPELKQEFNSLIARLEQKPVNITITHPRLGSQTKLVVSKRKFLDTLKTQLYSIPSRTMVPLVIHQAYLNNYMPLAGLIAQTDIERANAMYIGLTFNIVCNEDIPKLTDAMIARDIANNFGGDSSHIGWRTACPMWPKYQPSAQFYQSVTATVPTLILSGDLDPVTPPENGAKAAASLPNSRHFIVKNAAHNVITSGCTAKLIDQFLNRPEPDKLDGECLQEVPPESFMTSLNGNI